MTKKRYFRLSARLKRPASRITNRQIHLFPSGRRYLRNHRPRRNLQPLCLDAYSGKSASLALICACRVSRLQTDLSVYTLLRSHGLVFFVAFETQRGTALSGIALILKHQSFYVPKWLSLELYALGWPHNKPALKCNS